MARYPGVSHLVTRRLPRYYRFLSDLMKQKVERISSREFAEIIGFTASQIRQDLNCFGGFGQQGYGYNVASLHAEIGRILGLDKRFPAILIGMGNLGFALAANMDFAGCGFNLVGVFDSSERIIGHQVLDWVVRDVSELSDFCREHKPVTAVLCVPDSAAPDLADQLIELGVRSFWNYTHCDIAATAGDAVIVENVHLADSLMTLCYNVGEQLED